MAKINLKQVNLYLLMSFITHRIKKILKSILPETIVAFIVRARGEKLKSLDFSVLPAVKNAIVVPGIL